MVNELTWKRSQVLDREVFKMFVDDCKEICKLSEFKIYGGSGDIDSIPEFSENRLIINGIFDNNFRSKTFGIIKDKSNYEPDNYGLVSEFCKVGNHPVGITFMACLIAGKYHFNSGFYLRVDGKPEEWRESFILASAILGADLKWLVDILFDAPVEELKIEYQAKKEAAKPKKSREWIDTADVAKLVRKDLKNSFPGIKFTVRIERYSGGSSINVGWNNGPSEDKVSEIVGHYRAGYFNGMEDIYEYSSDSCYGNKFIFFRRELDNDLYIQEARRISKEWGIEVPEDITYNDLYNFLYSAGWDKGFDLQRQVCHEIHCTDY